MNASIEISQQKFSRIMSRAIGRANWSGLIMRLSAAGFDVVQLTNAGRYIEVSQNGASVGTVYDGAYNNYLVIPA